MLIASLMLMRTWSDEADDDDSDSEDGENNKSSFLAGIQNDETGDAEDEKSGFMFNKDQSIDGKGNVDKHSVSRISYGKSSTDTLDESRMVKDTIKKYDAVLEGNKYGEVPLNQTVPNGVRNPAEHRANM